MTELITGFSDFQPGLAQATLSSINRRIIDALLRDDRVALEPIQAALRRTYNYVFAGNDSDSESSQVFALGRVACLLESVELAMRRTEPPEWKSFLRDETYKTIIDLVADGWMTVGDIAAKLKMAQPTTTKRLQRLASTDFVAAQPVGRQVYYRLTSAASEWLEGRAHVNRKLSVGRTQRDAAVPATVAESSDGDDSGVEPWLREINDQCPSASQYQAA
jgi:DNA-binding transcriptional ArsR family regulator